MTAIYLITVLLLKSGDVINYMERIENIEACKTEMQHRRDTMPMSVKDHRVICMTLPLDPNRDNGDV
jgi:hypothetical protein